MQVSKPTSSMRRLFASLNEYSYNEEQKKNMKHK